MASELQPLGPWMEAPGIERWYVVQTKPRGDAVAAANLRQRAVGVYFPRLAARHHPAVASTTESSDIAEPLFPGYLFARLALREKYWAVAWSPGVRGFVSFGEGSPEPVDDEVVESLRQRAGGGEILRPADPLLPGTAVEIRGGPFAGLLGTIDRPLNGAGRVRVLLDLLRRQTRVDLQSTWVARL